MGTNSNRTIAGLRAWARGSYPEEAAVELLGRAFGGRFASPGWPWVRACEHAGWYWLDPEAIWTGTASLSSGERRMLNVVAALVGGQPLTDLGGTLTGLDRRNLVLVLAAFAHAAGSHEHSVLVMTGDDTAALERPGAVIEWPTPVEAVQ